jgi:hypothetical protein
MLAGLFALAGTGPVLGQEVLLQEGFNTDGEAATPPRYTMVGRDVYEPQRIRDELANFDQKGPIYWEHNFNVSYVGNPTIPGRRAIFTWRGVDASLATEDLLALFDSTIAWLLDGEEGATIVAHPNIAAMQGLADRLVAAGHTVVDDDNAGVPNDAEVEGDLFIHGPGASNPSRFVLRSEPVLVINAPDYDDMLVGSIGTAVNFEPGQVTISATGHPAVGGKTGSFDAFTGATDFEIAGSYLPSNAVVAATVTRIVPPAVSSLADVDAMIAGTKENENTTEQHTALDFSDASTGQWFIENPIPGGYTGNWGLRILGELNVSAPGTYRFAVGSDDGARLQIDRDNNGFTDADTIIQDPGPHAHQIVYANVEFTAAGNYDFQLLSYNSAGGGSLEFSVGIVPAAEITDDNLDSGFWELVGTDGATAPVTLEGQAEVTAYMATGANVERQEPLVVLLNGPTETPPGAFYDGGPISGFEGTGFIGASGLNKWAYPEETGTYRYVRLNPVNVAGKQNVRLTVALAATVVDFETSDFVDIMIYTNGLSSTPVQLAHFRGVQDAVQPWLADERRNFERRLTRQFADFSYDIPAGVSEVIVEIRAATSWWTEIAAVDNVRITAGSGGGGDGPELGAPTISGGNLNLTWTSGQAPFVVQWTPTLPATWMNLVSTSQSTASVPVVGPAGFYRVQSGGTATVRLFKATLSGANEVPVVDTPATGSGVFALEGNKLTYHVSYTGLKADATLAHIHGPATTTASASPLFDLVPVPAFGTSGVLSGTRDLTAEELGHLEAGMTYANIHTSVHGGGEIRGQVVPAQ